MSTGYVYAFWHEMSPANTATTTRVKIGYSTKHPWGQHHELRGEKLAFGFDMFGFQRQRDVFDPIFVPNARKAEQVLKNELNDYLVEVENGGRCSEAYDLPRVIFDSLKNRKSI